MRLDPEAWRFVLPLVAVTALVAVWQPVAASLPAAALAFTAWFFRDPRRDPASAADGWLAPADGKVIEDGPERLSIFMNVFDVHVCRAPIAGRVVSVRHHPGRFLAAWRDDAPEANERTEVVVDGAAGRCRFVLVAGLVARRIVCRVAEGDVLARGDRVGVIRFGSRVDIHLPRAVGPAVRNGARTVAGRTIVARAGDEPL